MLIALSRETPSPHDLCCSAPASCWRSLSWAYWRSKHSIDRNGTACRRCFANPCPKLRAAGDKAARSGGRGRQGCVVARSDVMLAASVAPGVAKLVTDTVTQIRQDVCNYLQAFAEAVPQVNHQSCTSPVPACVRDVLALMSLRLLPTRCCPLTRSVQAAVVGLLTQLAPAVYSRVADSNGPAKLVNIDPAA